jgi:chemotaxis protein histidine kinase CheA/ActR/RegA family two-component response regulator
VPFRRAAASEELNGPGLVAALSRLAQAIGEAAVAEPGDAIALQLADAAQSCVEADRAAAAESVAGLPELLRLLGAGLRSRAARAREALDDGETGALLAWAGHALAFAGGDRDLDTARSLLETLHALPWVPPLTPRLHEYLVRRLASSAGGGVAGAALPVGGAAPAAAPMADDFLLGVEPEAALTAPDGHALPGTTEGAYGQAAAEAAIWIAPAELELAMQAIQERVLPQAEVLALDTGHDASLTTALVDECAWQCQLVANALEMLGLAALSSAFAAASAGLPGCAREDRAALLAATATAALGLLASPDAAAAGLLADTLEDPRWPGPIDAVLRAAMLDEAARVVVGIDPEIRARRRRHASAADADLRLPDDVSPAVLAGMLRELPDRAVALNGCLQWLGNATDDGPRDTARRLAHTIKGDANTVGVRGLAEIAHAMEDVLDELARLREAPPPPLAAVLIHAGDVIEGIADHLVNRAPAPADVQDLLQQLLDWSSSLLDADLQAAPAAVPAAAPAPAPAPAPATGTATASSAPSATQAAPAPAATDAEAADITLNVPLSLLDDLLRLSGEAIVMARQVEERVRTVGGVHRELLAQRRRARDLLAQLDDLSAMRGAALQSARMAAGGQVDSLELDQYNELHVVSRRLIEADSDDTTQLQSVDRELSRLDDLLALQERTQAELQQSVLRTRTLPFRTLSARLQRAGRQAARTLLKEAEVFVDGGNTPVDSEVLERLAEPLMHAVRNAVDHGIEDPETRRAVGKPDGGRVTVTVSRDGNRIYVVVTDDGRGLDLEAIRARAVGLGLLSADVAASADVLARLILLPGFSTRSAITQVSGRGIGMDVINQRIAALRGTLRVTSERGRGTTLRIELPASMNSAHAAIARVGSGWAAIATAGVERFAPVLPDSLRFDADGGWLAVDGQQLRALWIEALFGLPLPTTEQPPRVAALLPGEDGALRAILLREVEGMREVIIRALGPWVPNLPGVRGATILGSGAVAPVIDLGPLLGSTTSGLRSVAPEADTRPDLVVADDSLSVRRAIEQLFTDHGFRVRGARDGLEALDLVKARRPALLLVDLEMPRMNGLDLTAYLRSQDDTRALPVVMVTSRTTETHRRLAIEAGVDEMMTKPFPDDVLLNAVLRLLERGRSAGSLYGA